MEFEKCEACGAKKLGNLEVGDYVVILDEPDQYVNQVSGEVCVFYPETYNNAYQIVSLIGNAVLLELVVADLGAAPYRIVRKVNRVQPDMEKVTNEFAMELAMSREPEEPFE